MTYFQRLVILLTLSPFVAAFVWTRDDLSWWWLLIYWVMTVIVFVSLSLWMAQSYRLLRTIRDEREFRKTIREMRQMCQDKS